MRKTSTIIEKTPPSSGKKLVSFNMLNLSPIPMKALPDVDTGESVFYETDLSVNDLDAQSHHSLMEFSFSSQTVKTRLDKMSPQEVIEYLGKKFFPSVVGSDHNLDHTREAIRNATLYLRSIADDFSNTDDKLIHQLWAVHMTDSYKQMELLENSLESLDQEIIKLKESAAATVRNYEESRLVTNRQAAADKAAKTEAEKLVKRAELERQKLEKQIVQLLKRCPSTLEQTVEHIILNKLGEIYPLYQAIEVFDWLSLTEISSRKRLSPRLESRKIWLQNRILSQDINISHDLMSRSQIESTEFYEVRSQVKSNIQNLAVDANEHQKRDLSERVVELMKPDIRLEGDAISKQKLEDKRREEADIKDQQQKQQVRKENKSQLIRDSELLLAEASKITVKFVRRRERNRKANSSKKEITDFNTKLLNRFEDSGIDWKADEMPEGLENLIKAFQVTKYLEARVFNQSFGREHNFFEEMKNRVLINPYPLRNAIGSVMGRMEQGQESINNYQEIVKADFFSREKSVNNIENSINNLSLSFLRDEAYRAEVVERENKLRIQSGVVAKLMEEMRSKRITLLKLGSSLDPTDFLTDINRNDHVAFKVREFYRDISKKSSELHISEILSDETSIDNRSTMLSNIASTSNEVIKKADKLIEIEQQKINEENFKKSAEEKRLKKEERELAAKLNEKKNELTLLHQNAVANYFLLAETIRVAMNSSIGRDSISTLNVNSNYSSQKIREILLNKVESLSKIGSSASFESLIKEHGNIELSKLCKDVFDVKKATEEIGDSELEKVDNDIEFYSQTGDFLDKFNQRFIAALKKFKEDQIRDAQNLREKEKEIEREGLLQRQKVEEGVKEIALASEKKLQKIAKLERGAKELEEERQLRINKLQDLVDDNKMKWEKSQETQEISTGTEKEIAQRWTKIWFIRLRHAKANLQEVKASKTYLSEMLESDREQEAGLLEEIEKLKIPTPPVNSRSPVKSPNQRREVSEIHEQRGKDGAADIEELGLLKSELQKIKQQKEFLEEELTRVTETHKKELKKAIEIHEFELEAVRVDSDSVVTANNQEVARLKKEKQTLELQIEELNKKELAINIDYLKLKQTAVTNLLKILYTGLEDIAGESKKSEIIQGAKKAVSIAANSNLSNILETLGNNPNDIAIKRVVASNIRQNEENDRFLEELIDIENVVHEILDAVNRVTKEELHDKNARELERVKKEHKSELINIWQQLKRSQQDVQRITEEKKSLESEYKEEKTRYESLSNEEKIILLLSDARRWSQFPSWKQEDKRMFLEEIRKSSTEEKIYNAFKQVFSTAQKVPTKQLAESIFERKSPEKQKEILEEIEGYIEKISAKVTESNQLSLSQFRENALRAGNEIELQIILQANHAALVLNGDVSISKEEVEQIVQGIKKREDFTINNLFDEFHKKQPNFQSISSKALKDLTIEQSRVKIVEANKFIEQIQTKINVIKAEKEKDKARNDIVAHLKRIQATVHNEKLTPEDRAELLEIGVLTYQNSEEIKHMIIGLDSLDHNVVKDVYEVSRDFSISQITTLAQDIDKEFQKIHQKALNKILEKLGEEFSKELADQKNKEKMAIQLKQQEIDKQKNIAERAVEAKSLIAAEAHKKTTTTNREIETLKEKIITSTSSSEEQEKLLDKLQKQLSENELELEAATKEANQQKSRADKAESSPEDLTSKLQILNQNFAELSQQSNEQRIKLEKQNTEIREKLKEAIVARDQMAERIIDLERQINYLQSQIGDNESEKDLTIQNLQRDLKFAQDATLAKAEEIERLKKNLEDAEIIRKKQEEEASEITRNLQSQIINLSEKLKLLDKKSSQKIQELEQRIRELEQQLAEKGSSDEEKENLLIALREELVAEKLKLLEANKLLDQERERREAAEAKLKEILETLPELRQQFDEAKEGIVQLNLKALKDKEEFERVLELMIVEKKQSELLIIDLKEQITTLSSKLNGDQIQQAKVQELQDQLEKAIKDVQDKDEELRSEREKLLLKDQALENANKDIENLKNQILELTNQLESFKLQSEQLVESLQQRIAKLEQEKQELKLGDDQKDVAIAELKEQLRSEQEKLIKLQKAIELEKERFEKALASSEKELMKNEENLTKANQRIKGLQDDLSRIKENALLDIDKETDLASRHDEKATQHVSDLSIEELNDRFREINANSRNKSNPYTSVKIVTALNKIRNIMKSFDAQGHSQPMWENIWNDHSLQNVNDSRFTLTSGDKGVLARFVLQRSEKSVPNNPSDIEKVIHVSKQLIKMVPDWESFYKDLISGKSKTVNLVVSGNPSTSPAPRHASEKEKPSLINML